jgi:hypothetical protein
VGYGGAAAGAVVLDVGRLGQALFWGYDARASAVGGGDGSAEEEGWERAAACLDEAAEELARVPLGTTLFAGFPGTGWVSEHLDRMFEEDEGGGDDQDGDGGEDDPNREIDRAVLEHLRSSDPLRRRYNLFAGWAGHGVYALERLPRRSAVRILERVVELLAGSAEETAAGITWRTPAELLGEGERRRFPHGFYPLGLGHGIPGVLALLAAARCAGVAPERAGRLLEGGVEWLLAAGTEVDGRVVYPPFLPAPPPGSASGSPVASPELPPLSWCCGEAGVAAGLLGAARAVGEPRWESAALELARAAAARPPADGGVVDAGLCHGAAGVAHAFLRLHRATGDERCADAARRWFRDLLDRRRPGRGETGFFTAPRASHFGSPGGEAELAEVGGLMRGVAGIGLTLLAATSEVPPAWDRLLLLSHRDGGGDGDGDDGLAAGPGGEGRG